VAGRYCAAMWNVDAYSLLDVPIEVDAVAEARVAAFELRWGFTVPAAVREWIVGDWRDWTGGQFADCPPRDDRLELLSPAGPGSRFLVVDRDSQNCCAFVVSVDEHDDPPVFLVDPDDTTGASRSVYAERFTAFTQVMVWDGKLFKEIGEFEDSRALPPGALPWLLAQLEPLPTTLGWAGNQGCDAVHRFDGPAAVLLAVEAGTILHSYVVCDDPHLRAEVTAALRS
jgi:hypothetical protein